MMRHFVFAAAAALVMTAPVGGLLAQQAVEAKSATPATASQPATQPSTASTASAARPGEPQQATAPVDPSGSWKWQFETPENPIDLTLKLKWDGKMLDGTYTGFDTSTKVEQGKVEKDDISFVVRPDFGGNQFEIKFKGKVAKDEIRGTIGIDFGGQAQEFPWTAKRFVDPEDVIGVWNLTIDAPQFGELKSTLTVKKGDKGLQAQYANEFFDLAAKNVQIKGNDLLFEIASENGDFSFKSNYQGTPRGNSIEGKSTFDFGGNAGEMKFTGKRQSPKEEPKADATRPAATAQPGDKSADGKSSTGEQKSTTRASGSAAKSDGK